MRHTGGHRSQADLRAGKKALWIRSWPVVDGEDTLVEGGSVQKVESRSDVFNGVVLGEPFKPTLKSCWALREGERWKSRNAGHPSGIRSGPVLLPSGRGFDREELIDSAHILRARSAYTFHAKGTALDLRREVGAARGARPVANAELFIDIEGRNDKVGESERHAVCGGPWSRSGRPH